MNANRRIRDMQMKVLNVFASSKAGGFALAGGTALELFYLKHRFSKDLDFFARDYDTRQIDHLVETFGKIPGVKIKPESEFVSATSARVKFCLLSQKGLPKPLKIDFVEDVITHEPTIRKFEGIPVYGSKDIYLHKIAAIAGTRALTDATGRQVMSGRNEARDAIDLYYLSKKVMRLAKFLEKLPSIYQTGMVHWYRTYSRHDFNMAFLDENLYDEKLTPREVIKRLDDEIKSFIGEAVR